MEVSVEQQGESALLLKVVVPGQTTEGWTRKFIVGMDTLWADPFVAKVPKRVQTLEEAFAFLVPKVVKDAIDAGLDVKRQGEWFFVPSEPPSKFSATPKEGRTDVWLLYAWHNPVFPRHGPFFIAPLIDSGGNKTRHVAEEIVYRVNNRHYVRGVILAPDHDPLPLGREWHLAIQRCYSQSGRGRSAD